MEKIPTAEEFYLKTVFPTSIENKPNEVKLWFETDEHAKENVNIMIEFAKLHVEAALKEATLVAFPDSKWDVENSYPLSNIK